MEKRRRIAANHGRRVRNKLWILDKIVIIRNCKLLTILVFFFGEFLVATCKPYDPAHSLLQ